MSALAAETGPEPKPGPPGLVAIEPERDPAAPPSVPRPVPRLELPPYDLGAALELERELGIGHVLAQVLVRRGFSDPFAAQAFLEPTDAHSPLEFEGIEEVLDTVGSHIASRSRIVVHGDYDVDGVCATAILVRALRSLGADVGWFLPSRERDGYGLASATVERLAARGTGLLITVDCGITAVDEVGSALEVGLDVVVTDHHTPRADGALPSCGIVHPTVCGYPCPDLCGAGVALKLAEALGASTAAADLDLVALATVADLVPLRGENRRLARAGIAELANTVKPGLRALLAVSRTDPSALDAHAIGYRLAPRINAAGRLRTPDAGLELLLTDDPARASELAAGLDAVNAERRTIELRIGWEADALVAALGERPIYVLDGAGWHPGVIGIVASRLVERYHRPAILIARNESTPGKPAQGSGRSIPGFDLLAALRAGDSELLRYGGHRAAAGLTIDPARIEAFRARVEAHAGAALTPELLVPVERVDAVASGGSLGLDTAEQLASLEPCGIGNPGARVLIPGARFSEVRTIGEGRHARFTVSSGGARARAVAFGRGTKLIAEGDGEAALDATFRLDLGVFAGAVEPRLVLGHARPCEPPPIVVIGEPDDYLTAMLAEVDRVLPSAALGVGLAANSLPAAHRTVLDRRDESALVVLADARAAGTTVAICADVSRRLAGLGARTGGFALAAAEAVRADPALVRGFEQIVVLDPPAGESVADALMRGPGFVQLAWGEAELRFAERMHEFEYGLRDSLVALYREFRLQQRAWGEELERLLRGDGTHGRSPRLAGRLVRVLIELGLVELDRGGQAATLTLLGARRRAELHESEAYRYYDRIYEDGRRFLSNATSRAAA